MDAPTGLDGRPRISPQARVGIIVFAGAFLAIVLAMVRAESCHGAAGSAGWLVVAAVLAVASGLLAGRSPADGRWPVGATLAVLVGLATVLLSLGPVALAVGAVLVLSALGMSLLGLAARLLARGDWLGLALFGPGGLALWVWLRFVREGIMICF